MPERFASVTVVDAADSPTLARSAEELRRVGARVALGTDFVRGRFDLCVASPGIPPHAPIMVSARLACDRIVSELEFAYTESTCAWVAVTGTNGKTTTTALVKHLLNAGGIPARAVGNIGTPAIEVVGDCGREQVLVAEVSSFQLALTTDFHPRVAVLLNITPDHIDWHGTMERYAADKAKVFANLGPDDVAVIDVDDVGSQALLETARATGARVVTVERECADTGAARLAGGVLTIPDRRGQSVALIGVGELKIRGAHNVSNALAAATAAAALGVTPADLCAGLRSFAPIEHRLEPIGVLSGAEWFNDSKATNPDAVSKALAAFGGRPIVLLAGGRNKKNDFAELAAQAAQVLRGAVLFGEAAAEINESFERAGIETVLAPGLGEAVGAAAAMAEPGDAVILSPACASFDEFKDYEERGRVFKRLVLDAIDRERGA